MIEIEEKVLEFYRRVIFGKGYKSGEIEKITEYCFNNAWNDMARTLKSNDENSKKVEVENLKSGIKGLICDKINDGLKHNNLKHSLKHINISNLIENCQKENKINKNLIFSYGQAQKVVNMFFKYIYTFKEKLSLNEEDFNNCDCPIDNINLGRIKNYDGTNQTVKDCIKNIKGKENNYKYSGCSWSNLDKDKYQKLQGAIEEIVNEEKKYKNKLDYEFGWK